MYGMSYVRKWKVKSNKLAQRADRLLCSLLDVRQDEKAFSIDDCYCIVHLWVRNANGGVCDTANG